MSGPRLLSPSAVENVKKWTFYDSAQRDDIVVFAYTLDSRACGRKGEDRNLIELVQPNLVLLTSCPPRVNV